MATIDEMLGAGLMEDLAPFMEGGPSGTGTNASGGGFLSDLSGLTGAIGNFLGGTGGQLLGAGLSLDALNEARQRAREAVPMFQDIAARGAEAAAFKPFTVSTGFGGVTTTPEGGFTTTLSPQQVAQQQQLQAITGGLLGGMGAVAPDVSGIQQQALQGVTGALTGAMAPMGAREADVYERIRATQRPEEQRAQLALEERLAAQGRTGLRTAQFGGSPEQLALAQAQEEAKARASLAALEQAQAEQKQQLGMAESLFGLGGRAAGLPQALQLGQLQNIGLAQAAQYQPEQELLASLTPAITLANIANTGQQYGAKTMTGVEAAGLENLLEAEQRRSSDLASIYGDILGAAAAQRQGQPQTSIVSDVSGLFSALRDFF
jgi:hypothetical protein